jgi:hypothetical protein
MFRNEISSEISFEGTTREVWDVLTDLERYGEWNPGFVEIHGRAEVGARLDVTFAKDGGRGMTMHPTVLVADPEREFRWLGRLLVPNLFDGEHRFEIHQDGPGRVRFVQAERFGGLLVPFLRRMIERDTLAMFERVNTALAERVAALRAAA